MNCAWLSPLIPCMVWFWALKYFSLVKKQFYLLVRTKSIFVVYNSSHFYSHKLGGGNLKNTVGFIKTHKNRASYLGELFSILTFAFPGIWLREAANHEPLVLWMGVKSNWSQTNSFPQKKILDLEICSWRKVEDGHPMAMALRYSPCFLATEISVLIFQFFL